MDVFFRERREKLVSEIRNLCRYTKEKEERGKRVKSIDKIAALAQEIDMVYRVATEGFKKENRKVSERLFSITQRLFKELEEKETLLEEAKKIEEESKLVLEEEGLSSILEYAERLSRYSKCPLLWTEGTPLEKSFPSFPADDVLQQSILRIESKEKPSKEKKKQEEKQKEQEEEKQKEEKQEEFTFEI